MDLKSDLLKQLANCDSTSKYI